MVRLTTGTANVPYGVLRYSLFALLVVICFSYWTYSRPPSVVLLSQQPASAHEMLSNNNARGFMAEQNTYTAAEDTFSEDDYYDLPQEDLEKSNNNDAQFPTNPTQQQQQPTLPQDCDASSHETCRILLEAAHLTIAQLERQNGELMNELNAARIKHRREMVKLRQELNEVYGALGVAEGKLDDLQAQALHLTGVVSQHEQAIVQLEAQIQGLQAQAQQLKDELRRAYENTDGALREERERLLAKLVVLQGENGELSNENAGLQTSISNLLAQLQTGQAEAAALTDQVEGLNALVLHLVEQLQGALQSLDSLSTDTLLPDATSQPPIDAANRAGLSPKSVIPVPNDNSLDDDDRKDVRGAKIEKSMAKGEVAKDAPLTLDGKLEVPPEERPQESIFDRVKHMVWSG